jgi:hypothetical protein
LFHDSHLEARLNLFSVSALENKDALTSVHPPWIYPNRDDDNTLTE